MDAAIRQLRCALKTPKNGLDYWVEAPMEHCVHGVAVGDDGEPLPPIDVEWKNINVIKSERVKLQKELLKGEGVMTRWLRQLLIFDMPVMETEASVKNPSPPENIQYKMAVLPVNIVPSDDCPDLDARMARMRSEMGGQCTVLMMVHNSVIDDMYKLGGNGGGLPTALAPSDTVKYINLSNPHTYDKPSKPTKWKLRSPAPASSGGGRKSKRAVDGEAAAAAGARAAAGSPPACAGAASGARTRRRRAVGDAGRGRAAGGRRGVQPRCGSAPARPIRRPRGGAAAAAGLAAAAARRLPDAQRRRARARGSRLRRPPGGAREAPAAAPAAAPADGRVGARGALGLHLREQRAAAGAHSGGDQRTRGRDGGQGHRAVLCARRRVAPRMKRRRR